MRRGGGDLIVGGAKDPAEGAAERLAAKAIAGGAKSTSIAGGRPAVRRSTAGTAIAPGTSSARAPKQAATFVSSLGSGRHLNAAERGYFEPRMGVDFSGVRLHEGRQVDRATRALDAEAFAHGPDIAFASGKRSRETMAHELAHVVQDGAPRLRRSIITDLNHRRASNLRYKLRKDYGVKGVVRLRQKKGGGKKATTYHTEYFLGSSIRSGPLNKQIASGMLASGRQFRLKGNTLHESEAALRDHLKSRRGIVNLSRTIRVRFHAKNDNLLGGVMKFIDIESRARLRARVAKMATKPSKRELSQMLADETAKALKRHAGSKKIRDAVREVRKKSRAYDRLKGKPGAEPFVAACFSATATVAYGGADSDLKLEHLPLPTAGVDVYQSDFFNDWIPGDWGYIKSYIVNPSPGLEGENIIYVGNNLFWGHFSSVHKPEPLKAWIGRVASWEQHKVPKAKRGLAELLGRRKYPIKGLR